MVNKVWLAPSVIGHVRQVRVKVLEITLISLALLPGIRVIYSYTTFYLTKNLKQCRYHTQEQNPREGKRLNRSAVHSESRKLPSSPKLWVSLNPLCHPSLSDPFISSLVVLVPSDLLLTLPIHPATPFPALQALSPRSHSGHSGTRHHVLNPFVNKVRTTTRREVIVTPWEFTERISYRQNHF